MIRMTDAIVFEIPMFFREHCLYRQKSTHSKWVGILYMDGNKLCGPLKLKKLLASAGLDRLDTYCLRARMIYTSRRDRAEGIELLPPCRRTGMRRSLRSIMRVRGRSRILEHTNQYRAFDTIPRSTPNKAQVAHGGKSRNSHGYGVSDLFSHIESLQPAAVQVQKSNKVAPQSTP